MFGHLASHLWERFKRTGFEVDLDRAISFADAAIKLPLQHSPSDLLFFVQHFHRKYEHSKRMEDLIRAMDIIEGLPRRSSLIDSLHKYYLMKFAGLLLSRYNRTGSRNDLNEAIEISKPIIYNGDEGISSIKEFALSFITSFQRTGKIEEAGEAIEVVESLLNVETLDPIERAMYLIILSECFKCRWQEGGGAMGDFDETIHYAKSAVKLIPMDHAKRPLKISLQEAPSFSPGEEFGKLFQITLNDPVPLEDSDSAIVIVKLAMKKPLCMIIWADSGELML